MVYHTNNFEYLIDISTESLQKELPSIEIYAADLADWNKTEQVLNQIGDVDLLVNNAGLAILGPLTEVTEEDYDR